MKVNLNSIMMFIMVLTVLTSCHKPEYIPDYNYFNTGIYQDSFIVDSSSVEQTTFEYCSWVETSTKSCDRDVVRQDVILTAAIENVNTEAQVSDFDMDDGVIFIKYQGVNSSSRHHVYIKDSVLLVDVVYKNFTIEYHLPFQAASYYDGDNAGKIKSLSFGKDIVDNGYTLTDMQQEISDGKIFVRKLFQHSISIPLNGKRYHATALVVLKKLIAYEGDDYVTKSVLLDSGIKNLTNEENHTSYVSWISVQQTFNSGKKDTLNFEIPMYGIMSAPVIKMDVTDINLVCLNADFDNELEHLSVGFQGNYVKIFNYNQVFVVQYNYGTTETSFQYVEACYDDGYTKFMFPNIAYSNIVHTGTINKISEYGSYGEYDFTEKISAKFSQYTHSSQNSKRILLPN